MCAYTWAQVRGRADSHAATQAQPLMIDAKEIDLFEELGAGEFGAVMRGEWRRVSLYAVIRVSVRESAREWRELVTCKWIALSSVLISYPKYNLYVLFMHSHIRPTGPKYLLL